MHVWGDLVKTGDRGDPGVQRFRIVSLTELAGVNASARVVLVSNSLEVAVTSVKRDEEGYMITTVSVSELETKWSGRQKEIHEKGL